MALRASIILEFENQNDPYTSSCPSNINQDECSPVTFFPFLETHSFFAVLAILVLQILFMKFVFLVILAKRYCFSEYRNHHIPDASTFVEKLDTKKYLLAEKSSKSKEKFVRRGMEFLSSIRMSRIVNLNKR